MDPHIWSGKSRTTSRNIHPVAMWGYRLWLWRPAGGDERLGEVAREGQGYPCLWHGIMMMMMMMWNETTTSSIWTWVADFIFCDVTISPPLSSAIKAYQRKFNGTWYQKKPKHIPMVTNTKLQLFTVDSPQHSHCIYFSLAIETWCDTVQLVEYYNYFDEDQVNWT